MSLLVLMNLRDEKWKMRTVRISYFETTLMGTYAKAGGENEKKTK